MKYIKTFEKLITLDLSDNLQIEIMEIGLLKNKISIVEELLNSGFDPNQIIFGDPLLIYAFINNYDINTEILELIIKKGGDVNIYIKDEPFISRVIYEYNNKMNDDTYLEIFRLFLINGANLLLSPNYNRDSNTFDSIEDMTNNRKMSKRINLKLFNIIKEELPEQYEEYITMKKIKEDSEKYNI